MPAIQSAHKMRLSRVLVCVLLLAPAVSAVLSADTKEQKRLGQCDQVLQEALDLPDGLPGRLLSRAECVVIIP